MLSIVLLAPIPGLHWLHAIHWQILALFSLLMSIRASCRAKEFAAYPLGTHAFLLITLVCLHMVGFLASIVSIGAVFK